jgi:hypothetical protein
MIYPEYYSTEARNYWRWEVEDLAGNQADLINWRT